MPITTHRRTLADMTVEERFAALAAAEGPPELAYERDPWLAEAQANGGGGREGASSRRYPGRESKTDSQGTAGGHATGLRSGMLAPPERPE